jgi:AcrR family transcriptional regulator
MPKAFAAKEKAAIRRALMSTGLRAFARTGVRAARIEDICRDVGIAKGSFYAFFPNKEELFMAIADAREARHKSDMIAFVKAAEGEPREIAGAFFDRLARKIETDPLLAIVTAEGEIAHLVRRLGPERMAQGIEGDRRFVAEVAAIWPAPGASADDLLGLMTLMLAFITTRHAMTGEQYAPTLALLRALFVARMSGGAR